MLKNYLIIAILLLSIYGTQSQAFKCPNANALSLVSDSITVSSKGQIGLTKGVDIQCYNYTVATPFTCAPSVAISVSDLQSQYNSNLFFAIKAVNSDNLGIIPFIVRTQWGYTQWTKITFSFLAETSSQIQAGYYQVDSGSLSSCNSGKQIVAFIPYINQNSNLTAALTFLNGFEISSVAVNSSYNTPFQVQVVFSSVNQQGIIVTLSSTSATQIQSLFISYVVYDPNIQNLVAGSYVYSKYTPTSSLTFSPPIGVTNSNTAFHGFSGFIVKNNAASISFIGSLANGNLTFTTSSSYYYLSYSYFLLIGGACGQCLGYTISYNGNCVAACPPLSYFNGATCITCTTSQVWNGTACVAKITPVVPVVPSTPVSNTSTGTTFSCPIGTYWEPEQLRCLPCPEGCSACPSCYSCSSCVLGFYSNATTSLCSETCGDGFRFVLPCDDGNSISGDGCSSTCQIETGYFCSGGSPSSKDVCSKITPQAIKLTSSGQSHIWGSIIINVRLNYLPLALLQSASDCRNKCGNVLNAQIISGDASAVSIISSFIPNSSYSFSITVDFGKEPFGAFTLLVGVNPSLKSKYFSGIDTSATLNLNISPASNSINNAGSNLTR